jgi:hypothetical protein
LAIAVEGEIEVLVLIGVPGGERGFFYGENNLLLDLPTVCSKIHHGNGAPLL